MFFEEVRASLENGRQVKLSGFGNFNLRDKIRGLGATPKQVRRSRLPKACRDLSSGQKLKARVEAYAGSRSEERSELPLLPSKRYFTIGEVSELCAVKPHVLRYWSRSSPIKAC